MDYDDIESMGFWLLAGFPVVVVIIAGTYARSRQSTVAVKWYWFTGLLGSLLYIVFAGSLAILWFPPPVDEGVSLGNGLDFSGMGLIFGSWLGGAAGLITMLIADVIMPQNRALQKLRAGKDWHGNPII